MDLLGDQVNNMNTVWNHEKIACMSQALVWHMVTPTRMIYSYLKGLLNRLLGQSYDYLWSCKRGACIVTLSGG